MSLPDENELPMLVRAVMCDVCVCVGEEGSGRVDAVWQSLGAWDANDGDEG